MQKVKQMLSDEGVLREVNRQRNLTAPSGAIDKTLFETIMAHHDHDIKHSEDSLNIEKRTTK